TISTFSDFSYWWDIFTKMPGLEWTKMGVPQAMLIGSLYAVVMTRISPVKITNEFFNGMGNSYANVLGIIIAASVFVAGLKSTGAIDSAIEFLKHSNEFVRWGATIGPFLMGIVTGSGDAAAIAFNTAVTPHAVELGYTHVNLGMAAAIAGAIGRTASPIAGVTIVCAGLAMVSPVEMVKRTAPGMILAILFFSIVYVVIIKRSDSMSITLEQLIQWRREFHRFPEIGWSEFWTTSRIADYLEEMGFDILLGDKIINPEFVRGRQQAVVEAGLAKAIAYGAKAKWLDQMKGYTGCVAVLDTGKPGKTVALRFDIDCVNVSETTHPEHIPNQYGFASLNDGFMHACGHDAHITIGLGTAKWLAENKDKLRGKI
ncbi:hypothetical protein AAUPMB_13406, partial [Pasteurella multocida subsp. multocida str. Anand1_buffalo]